jgi:Domain of unknown function DUF29
MSEGAVTQPVELISFKEIPVFTNEQEEEEFWATHHLSNALLEKMQPIEHEPEPPSQRHQDFYAWTQTEAKNLRNRSLESLDLEGLTNEIEALGRQERRLLRNHLAELLTALITQSMQLGAKEPHQAVIRQHRREVQLLLMENPSLSAALKSLLEIAYATSRDLAVQETGQSYLSFSEICPYSLEQILDSSFLG